MIHETHQASHEAGVDVSDDRGNAIVQASAGERILQDLQKVLVYLDRHAERPQIDVDVGNLLQAHGVRLRAGDFIRDGLRARRIRGLAEGLDRDQQGREVVVGVRRSEGPNHEVHIGAHVQVLRHHRDGARARRR